MTPLDKLRTALGAIAPSEISPASPPLDAVLRDANRLHRTLPPNVMWPHMLGARDELLTAMAAAREAQDCWDEAADRDEGQLERVQAAVALRVEIMMACLRNVQGEPSALAMIEDVARGCEVTDLIEDLGILADLLEQHRAAFDADDSFDACEQSKAARRMAEELAASLAGPGPETAKVLRDRAYTYLASLVADLRGDSH